MANRERGEVTVEVEGRTYRLRFSINGMCEVEDLLSTAAGKRVGFNTFLTDYLPQDNYRDLRLAMWAALREHHPDMTIPQAGWLIDRIGWTPASAHLTTLLLGTQPDPRDMKALGVPDREGADARPMTARQAGTGGRFRLRRVRSGFRRLLSGISRSVN